MSASTSLRVHCRTEFLDGSRWSVLSPRPSEPARFATNLFDGAWHILCDTESAGLLARLMWALAFQRREQTMIVIDHALLVANPFDGDPSSPIVLVNTELGTPSAKAIGELFTRLPFATDSEGTVRLRTHGLDEAIGAGRAPVVTVSQPGERPAQLRRGFNRVNGVLMITVPGSVLRVEAYRCAGQAASEAEASDALYLGDRTGEIQVLPGRLIERAGQVVSAREGLFPGRGSAALSNTERQQLADHLAVGVFPDGG